MASEQIYRIVDSGTRGMIVVADRDIKAGELVVEEKEPLLFYSESDRKRYQCDDPATVIILAGYDAFNRRLSDEQRQKFVKLYGPMDGATANNARQLINEHNKSFAGLSSKELEMIVKVFQIVRLNMFGTEGGDYKVYAEITRFAHSCASNCKYSQRGKSIVCYSSRRGADHFL